MLFASPRQNINHSPEKGKVTYMKWLLFYALINCQFKTSELKNLEKLVEQTVQTLMFHLNELPKCISVLSV